jgi:hypothetical protein
MPFDPSIVHLAPYVDNFVLYDPRTNNYIPYKPQMHNYAVDPTAIASFMSTNNGNPTLPSVNIRPKTPTTHTQPKKYINPSIPTHTPPVGTTPVTNTQPTFVNPPFTSNTSLSLCLYKVSIRE